MVIGPVVAGRVQRLVATPSMGVPLSIIAIAVLATPGNRPISRFYPGSDGCLAVRSLPHPRRAQLGFDPRLPPAPLRRLERICRRLPRFRGCAGEGIDPAERAPRPRAGHRPVALAVAASFFMEDDRVSTTDLGVRPNSKLRRCCSAVSACSADDRAHHGKGQIGGGALRVGEELRDAGMEGQRSPSQLATRSLPAERPW